MSWTRARCAVVALLLELVAASRAGPASAAAGEDPEWPCVQRLVPELAAGQLWGGPPLDDLPTGAVLDPALATLPGELTARSLSTEAAVGRAVGAVAGLPEPARAAQRALLFRETLARINAERGELIAGIRRFASGQRRLAEKITADGRRLAEAPPPAPAAPGAELVPASGQDEARAAREWDIRVFDDRQRTLGTLCDQPVLLEQRAFALARALQE